MHFPANFLITLENSLGLDQNLLVFPGYASHGLSFKSTSVSDSQCPSALSPTWHVRTSLFYNFPSPLPGNPLVSLGR